jgi:predicted dehydrogenase
MRITQDLSLNLAGICDRNPDALVQAGDEFAIPPAGRFGDAAALLEAVVPECVIVASTGATHCEYTCLASEAGARYILCEKPMGMSLAECDRMLETCVRRGTRLAINHQMRFMEQYTVPKQLLGSEELGGLCSISVVGGNIGMAMNGTHYFEMFRYVAGEEPLEVTAWFSPDRMPNPRGREFEDRAGAVFVTTAGGKRLYMDISADQGHGLRATYAARYGQITVDELGGTVTVVKRSAADRSLPTTRYGTTPERETFVIRGADAFAPSRAVLNALLNGGDAPSGEEGRLAVATLVAAYLSDEGGHLPVRVGEADRHRERGFPWA